MQTPNSTIPSSAATNKQNCMATETLLAEQQKCTYSMRKKGRRGRSLNLKENPLTQTVNSFIQTKLTTKNNIPVDRALLSTD